MVYTYFFNILQVYAFVFIVFISYYNTMNVYPIYVGIIFQFILHVYTPPQHAFFKLNLTPNKKPLIFYWDPHNRLLRASIVDDLFPRKR